MCTPEDHNFELGGEGDGDEWEAWLFCSKCGTTAMVPIDARSPALIVAAKQVTATADEPAEASPQN